MEISEADLAARLIERLLADPAFRAEFRRDPAGACRDAGLERLADDMAPAAGKAMQTLDLRESRSSVAGVIMAAAMEGVGVVEFSAHVLPHIDELPNRVVDVISRVDLPAIGAQDDNVQSRLDAVAATGPSAEAPPAPDTPAGRSRAAAPEPDRASEAVESRRAERAAEKPAADRADAEKPAAEKPDAEKPDGEKADADVAADAPRARAAALAAEPGAQDVPAVAPDPARYGMEGTGGPPSPEAAAVLRNRDIVLDANGREDFSQGRIDPRIASILLALSKDHRIAISATASDHGQLTSGGSVSNHWLGRGLDIATVDGQPVNPSNPAAREVVGRLAALPDSIRPTEVGSPWRIAAAGFFTDSGHQDHIHLAFDDPISTDWKAPSGLGGDTATGSEGKAPATAADPGGDAAAPQPREPAAPVGRRDSLIVAAAPRPSASGSLQFLRAVDSPAPSEPGGGGGDAAEAAAFAGGPDDYPGDDAEPARVAAWMAQSAAKRGLPPELPVMASLVESGLKNLAGGDRDSVGFFQMRLGTWNSGPYAGYPDDPALQVKWFLDQAEAVKRQRIAAGRSVTDPGQYGEWIADVERPAEQYRGRYQERLAQAQGLLASSARGGGDAPPSTAANGSGSAAAEVTAAATDGRAATGPRALAAVKEAEKYLGTPYKWGGSTPQTGFDCSGLMQWAYAKAGITIPRVSQDQILASNATEVDRGHLRPGDLVFFRDPSGDVHHVGMSLGGDRFLHAPHTGDVVKISSLREPYYASQFTGGRRFDSTAPVSEAPVERREVDPAAVARAEAAVVRDAAEVGRRDSMLFRAVQVQEGRKARATVQFLKAVDPSQVRRSPAPAGGPPAGDTATEPPPEADAAAVDVAADAGGYPGDDASQADLAKWLAGHAKAAGLPPELPVMAALVESGVRNLEGGDADSAGFFQMRVGFWDSGPYAGYRDRPQLQIKWFIDQALAIKRQRVAAGKSVTDPGQYGEWIADVERPFAAYRGRYQPRLEEARALLRS